MPQPVVVRALRLVIVLLLLASTAALGVQRDRRPGPTSLTTLLTSATAAEPAARAASRSPVAIAELPTGPVPVAAVPKTADPVLPAQSRLAAVQPAISTSTTQARLPRTTVAPGSPPTKRNDVAAEALPPVQADAEQGEPSGYGGLGRVIRTVDDDGVTIDLATYPDPGTTYTPADRQWSVAVYDPRCERVDHIKVDFGDGTGMTASGVGSIVPCLGPQGWNYGRLNHRYPRPGRYQLTVTVALVPLAPPPTLDLHQAHQLVVVT